MSTKSKFFRLSNPIIQSFSFEKFLQKLPFRDLILVYHLASDEEVKHVKHLFPYRSVKQFENDLDFLSQYFDFLDWETFIKEKTEKVSRKKPTILLTFDDGYCEFYDIIAPILKRKGIFAVQFINPKFIDNQDLMWRNKVSLLVKELVDHKRSKDKMLKYKPAELQKNILSVSFQNQNQLDEVAQLLEIDFNDYLKKNPIYLTTEQVRQLKNDGFGISSHGWDHPFYNQLSLADQLKNTQKSLNFMKENQFLNDSFAFPFTDHLVTNEFFDSIFNQNPDLKFTFGAAGLKLDNYARNLQRIPMEIGNYSAKELLKNEILYYQILQKFKKNKIIRS
ncbi:MAG: polysaccharide deacetylase family protein [Weeksellaceae bacterium]|nr:polysaccharide deacetylase family protein [Weeksellaceae bacterium]